MERHLILVINETTGDILATRTVAGPLVDALVADLNRFVGGISTAKELKEGLPQFGFQWSFRTIAYRITGL
jgi:hypothetical protein